MADPTAESATSDLPLDDIGRRTRTAAGWRLLSQGLSIGLQMVTSIVLARLLMPRDFGVVAMAMLVTGLAAVFSELGLGQALVQRRQITAEHTRSAFWGTLVMGLLLCGLVSLAAPWVGAYFHEPRTVPALRLMSLTFVLSPFAVVPRSLLQRSLDFRTPFLAGLAGSMAYGGAGITTALLGFGYWSLVAAALASALVGTVALCLLARHVPPLIPTFRGIRDLYGFGVGVTASSLLNYAASQGDYLVVGRVLDAAALGLYTRAYTIVTAPLSTVSSAVWPVLFPAFSRLQNDRARLRDVFGRAITLLTMLGFPTVALLGVAAPELVLTLMGEQWLGAVVPIQIMTAVGMVRIVSSPQAAVFRAVGGWYVYGEAGVQFAYAGMIILGALSGARWGIVGVAGCVSAGVVVSWLLSAVLMWRASGFGARHYLAALQGPGVIALATALVAAVAREAALHIGAPGGVVLAAALMAGCAAGLAVGLRIRLPQVAQARGELQALALRAWRARSGGSSADSR